MDKSSEYIPAGRELKHEPSNDEEGNENHAESEYESESESEYDLELDNELGMRIENELRIHLDNNLGKIAKALALKMVECDDNAGKFMFHYFYKSLKIVISSFFFTEK